MPRSGGHRSDARDREETENAPGYYLEPGHVPVYEEDTEVLEFSPKTEYQQTIDVVNRNIAAAQPTK